MTLRTAGQYIRVSSTEVIWYANPAGSSSASGANNSGVDPTQPPPAETGSFSGAPTVAIPIIAAFGAIDATFLVSNSMKFVAGGWFPVLIGGAK